MIISFTIVTCVWNICYYESYQEESATESENWFQLLFFLSFYFYFILTFSGLQVYAACRDVIVISKKTRRQLKYTCKIFKTSKIYVGKITQQFEWQYTVIDTMHNGDYPRYCLFLVLFLNIFDWYFTQVFFVILNTTAIVYNTNKIPKFNSLPLVHGTPRQPWWEFPEYRKCKCQFTFSYIRQILVSVKRKVPSAIIVIDMENTTTKGWREGYFPTRGL